MLDKNGREIQLLKCNGKIITDSKYDLQNQSVERCQKHRILEHVSAQQTDAVQALPLYSYIVHMGVCRSCSNSS